MTTSTLTALYAFAAGLATSGVAFSGAFVLWLSPRKLERLVPNLVALAVGVLLGDAFIHLIPDAVARHGDVGEVCLAVLGGMFLFFSLEKWVRWRHDHTVTSRRRTDTVEAMARMNLIGDAVHNFIDGILIAGSFWTGDPLQLLLLPHRAGRHRRHPATGPLCRDFPDPVAARRGRGVHLYCRFRLYSRSSRAGRRSPLGTDCELRPWHRIDAIGRGS